jgi:hypothetical protein
MMTGLNFSTTRFNPFTPSTSPLVRPQSEEAKPKFSFASAEAFSTANSTSAFTRSSSFTQSLERGEYTIGTTKSDSILGKLDTQKAEASTKTYQPLAMSGAELSKKFGVKKVQDYAKGWPERSEAPKVDAGMLGELQNLYKANFPMENKWPAPYLGATKENKDDKFDTNLEINLPRLDGKEKGAKGYHVVVGNDGSMRVRTDEGWLQNLDPETANGILRQAMDTLKTREDVKTEGVSDVASGKVSRGNFRAFNYSADGDNLVTSPNSKPSQVDTASKKTPTYDYKNQSPENNVSDYYRGITDSLKDKTFESKPYDSKTGTFKPQLTEANQAYPHDPTTGERWQGEFVSTKTADGKSFYGIKQEDGTTAFSAQGLKLKVGKESFDVDQATYALKPDGTPQAWVRQGNDWMPVTEEAFGKEDYASWMKQLGSTFGFTPKKQELPPPPVSSTIA